MTKHIAGLILFTFIVGTSAVVAGLFYEAPQKLRSFSVRDDQRVYKRKKRKRRCRHGRYDYVRQTGAVSSGITQAAYDKSTGLLSVSHNLENEVADEPRGALIYHFYVKDEFGTRHVKSERVGGHLESSNLISAIEWLQNRHSTENLYLGSEYRDIRSFWRIAPKFENSNAIPVLVKNDK